MKFLPILLLLALCSVWVEAGPTQGRGSGTSASTEFESDEDSNEVQDDEPSLEEQDLIIAPAQGPAPKAERGWLPEQETVSNKARPSTRDDDDSEEEDEQESFDDFNPEDVVDSDVGQSPSFPVSTWPESSYGTRNGLTGLRSIFKFLPFNVQPARVRPTREELQGGHRRPDARFYQEEMPIPIFLSGF